ncbi:MAG: PH domain-containing protein [Candidatus Dormibacteria bacterium]
MLILLPVQEVLRSLPLLLGLLVAGSSSGGGPEWSLIGAALAIGAGTLRWFTTTYRITDDQVQVRRGLLRRRTLTVLRDRLRTVDVTAHALHRVLGLARVTIGTGRSDRRDEGGLKLDGLSVQEAAQIRELLLSKPAAQTAAVAATTGAAEVELARWHPGWIAYGPFTLSGIVTVLVVAGFGYRILSAANLNPTHLGPIHSLLHDVGRTSPALVVLAISALAVVVIVLFSTVGYVLAFWDFRLTRQASGTLHVSRGLVTTRAVTIDENRLRGIEFSEPLLLRAVQGARCIAIATGLRVGRGAERGGSMLLPPAPRRVAMEVAAAILGDADPICAQLIGHGPIARRRRYNRVLLVVVPVLTVLVATWWLEEWPAWPWLAGLVALAASLPLAADRFHSLGHAVVGGRLVARSGSLVRRRCVLSADGIIGWNLDQSFFQRRSHLVTLIATTAAGRQAYQVQDLGLAEAVRVGELLMPGLLAAFFEEPRAAAGRPAARDPSIS